MPLLAQCFDSIEREVLVGEKAHPLDRNSINFFSFQRRTGIAKAGLYAFEANARIVPKNFIGTPALSKEINDELNRKTSGSDNGFTDRDIWVESDARLLSHEQVYTL